jgi:hypothetical protein
MHTIENVGNEAGCFLLDSREINHVLQHTRHGYVTPECGNRSWFVNVIDVNQAQDKLFSETWRNKMKTITTIIATCMLVGTGVVLAAGQGSGAGGADAAPMPQTMEQNMTGQPAISADGINNASQVEDPADIGRTGDVSPDAPTPLPVEGSAGVQQAK